jgi:serine protease Do
VEPDLPPAPVVPNLPSTPVEPDLPSAARTRDETPTSGRPSLGVTVRDLAPDVRRFSGIAVTQGAMVSAVRTGSPASLAGIPMGAVIVAFDGRRIASADDLVQEVISARVGQEVELSYYAGDRLRKTKVELTGDGAAAKVVPPPLGVEPDLPATAPSPGGQRPLLDRFEGGLDNVVRPDERPAPTMKLDTTDVVELRRQLETVRSQMDLLQKRLTELDARLRAVENPKP